MSPDHLSRREFLKTAAAFSAAALRLPGLSRFDTGRFDADPPPPGLDPYQELLWERFDMQITANGVIVKFSDAGKNAIDNWHDPWLPNTGDIVNALALYFDKVYHRQIDANLCNNSLIQTFSVPQMPGGEPLLIPIALPSGETIYRLNRPQDSKHVQIDVPKQCLYSLVDSQPQMSSPAPAIVTDAHSADTRAAQSGDNTQARPIQEQPDPPVSTSPITSEDLTDFSEEVQFYTPIAFCLAVPVGLTTLVAWALHEARKPVRRRTKTSTSVAIRPQETGDPYFDTPQTPTSLPVSSPLGSRANFSPEQVTQLAEDYISMEVSEVLRGRATGVKTTVTEIGGRVAYFDVTGFLDKERVEQLFLSGDLQAMEERIQQRLGVSEVHIVANPDKGGITVIAGNDHATTPDMLRIPSNRVFHPLDNHGRLFTDGGRIGQHPQSKEFTVFPSQSDAEKIEKAEEWLRTHDHKAWTAYIREGRDPQTFYRFTDMVDGSDGGIPVPKVDTAHTHYHIVTPTELKQEAGAADDADAADKGEIGDEEVAGRSENYKLLPQTPRPPLPPPYLEGDNVIHSKDDVTRLLGPPAHKK